MAEFKDTLNLPQTDFSMRAGLAQKEPEMLAEWKRDDLYGQIQAHRQHARPFVFHDGPPYANGHLHHGHILNKILKDLVVKDRTMTGYRVEYVPGWDCHGLPIEVQVDKELGRRKADMSQVEIRAACRAYAQKFVEIQREELQRLGILCRWDDPYLTMNYAYEAATLRELGRFVDSGLLYKGLRPVNWCVVHQTALAEAEVEYEDHRSPSIYVSFALQTKPSNWDAALPLNIVIWTTTPWTLPANLAIAVHPDFEYIAYPVRGEARIIARGLVDSFLAAVGEPAFDSTKVMGTWQGSDLEKLSYKHPLFARTSPVLLGHHVTLEAGTGCVHTAPGHGAEDFELGRRHGLEVLSPVDNAGVFKAEAGPYAGKKAFDANKDIIADLERLGALLSPPEQTIAHRYAHCWRCHQPIMLRATEQWWVALDKPYKSGGSLRERALASLKEVEWIPKWGEERIAGMLATRPDWCLSRQRIWGVPIAVLYCEGCDHALVDSAIMNKIADIFEKAGADAWFSMSVEELLGPMKCPSCSHNKFRKERDILDVWFDSGVSFAAVIEREKAGHETGAPIDLYLEGSDQHRGWFHSSLLCSLVTRQRPPYRRVLTHGFVVDGEGKKISKSKGNFVDPFKTIGEHGAELLRLWVAGEEYREDIRISNEILTRLADTYRKVRNTFRYLLGNLSDFDPNNHLVEPKNLQPLDAYALAMSAKSIERMRAAYNTLSFHLVVQTMTEFCTVDLSAFYLDVLKDRLYASAAGSVARRSAQTAIYLITRDLLRILAPVLSFTCEEAWRHLPRLAGDASSVHLCTYPGVDEPESVQRLSRHAAEQSVDLLPAYAFLRELRRVVNTQLEAARREKRIGSSVEAEVTLKLPADEWQRCQRFAQTELEEAFIVSRVCVEKSVDSSIEVIVNQARGTKCPRCWLYREHLSPALGVCSRCNEALT